MLLLLLLLHVLSAHLGESLLQGISEQHQSQDSERSLPVRRLKLMRQSHHLRYVVVTAVAAAL